MPGQNVVAFFALTILLVSTLPFYFWLRARSRLAQMQSQLNRLNERFKPVLDIESEVAVIRSSYERIEKEIFDLRSSYSEKKNIYDRLVNEVAIYEEQANLAQIGVYSPHFQFTDSDQFKVNIQSVRAEQKAMVSGKIAIQSFTDWEVSGSKTEGKKMTGRAVRLSLRAFNNECDAALSNVRWNNVHTLEKRIQRAYEQIDKLNESLNISINPAYFNLKIKELRLTHEYREKQKEERDHKSEMARLKREEEKLLRDAAIAEKEEVRYQKLLDQAKAEAAKNVGFEAERHKAQIDQLSRELQAARAKAERAKSMAEQTRAGHVYVISNVGSFGGGVYKIGMTRRLEPTDRVKELGDASVPFVFDTHAMVFCDDAPSVEKKLHSVFDRQRVNRANGRKEFFRVSLDKITEELQRIAPEADIITGIEAQEYHETLAMIAAEEKRETDKISAFPEHI